MLVDSNTARNANGFNTGATGGNGGLFNNTNGGWTGGLFGTSNSNATGPRNLYPLLGPYHSGNTGAAGGIFGGPPPVTVTNGSLFVPGGRSSNPTATAPRSLFSNSSTSGLVGRFGSGNNGAGNLFGNANTNTAGCGSVFGSGSLFNNGSTPRYDNLFIHTNFVPPLFPPLPNPVNHNSLVNVYATITAMATTAPIGGLNNFLGPYLSALFNIANGQYSAGPLMPQHSDKSYEELELERRTSLLVLSLALTPLHIPN